MRSRRLGTIKRAGLDDALDKHAEAAKVGEPAETMDAKLERLKQEQLTPEQRLVKEILADPTAVHAYLDLAEMYRHRSDLDKAEKVLAKGLKANPGEQGLLAIYEDNQISRLKRAIESQKQRVLQHPEDTGAKAKLDQITEMLNKYEVEAFRRRVSLHPEDPQACILSWAWCWRRTGAHDDAIAEFQQRPRPARVYKIQALHQAGSQLRGQQCPQARRSQLQRGLEDPRARGKGELSSTALPGGPGVRGAGKYRRLPKSITTKSPTSTTAISTSPSG